MYHAIVRRNLRKSFAEVNRGNYPAIVRQFTPAAEHWFSGSHALGGGRHDNRRIQQWYDRLAALLPDLRFELTKVSAKGWPWDTVAFVEWVDHLTDREGNHYSNQGVHVIRIAWGKITELHIYCDTALLASVLDTLAAQGVSEASAPPVGDPGPFRAAAAPVAPAA
ncbi:nuclear transport factor 2 family protein [Streptomyces sp. NPDC004031]